MPGNLPATFLGVWAWGQTPIRGIGLGSRKKDDDSFPVAGCRIRDCVTDSLTPEADKIPSRRRKWGQTRDGVRPPKLAVRPGRADV